MNKFIRELLNKNGLKQNELAQILGISAAAVSQWESTENIKPEILYNLSKLFSISIDNLISEKFNDETNAEKYDRLYNLDGYEFKKMIDEKDSDMLLVFSSKLRNINEKMYELLYLKMTEKINVNEKEELEYLHQFISEDINTSPYFREVIYPFQYGEDRDLKIAKIISEHIDIKNKNAFIWELKKIYYIKKRIDWWKDIIDDFERVKEILTDEMMCNILLSYPDIEKDKIATKYSRDYTVEMTDYLISMGFNIIYSHQDFQNFDAAGYFSNEDLAQFEGEKIHINELDQIRAILDKSYNNINLLGYDDYQKIINKCEMKRKQYFKYRDSNPIKHWEFFKEDLY